MESSVREFFERYEKLFNQSLGGDANADEVAALYASEFIAASPAGVRAGKNDEQLKQVMAQGYARYRAMGTKQMRIAGVRLSPIDDRHCVAHVAWTATYARKGRADVVIDFDVHYFVQALDGKPKVFGGCPATSTRSSSSTESSDLASARPPANAPGLTFAGAAVCCAPSFLEHTVITTIDGFEDSQLAD
jgi:hypothetical protein